MPLPGIAPIKKGGEAASLPLNLEPNESKVKRTNHVNDCFLPLISSFLSSSHSLSYRLCPIRPFGAPSPRGEGCDTRIPSSKKTARYPCEPIRSPASSSRAQPRDLSCTAVGIPHVPAGKQRLHRRLHPAFFWLQTYFAIGLQGRFLDFARNDDTRVSLSAPPP